MLQEGNTALHLAAARNFIPVVLVLLNYGADPLARNQVPPWLQLLLLLLLLLCESWLYLILAFTHVLTPQSPHAHALTSS